MAELISDARVTARKHHCCFHCQGWIVPGEAHRKTAVKGDYFYSLREHDDCRALWAMYEKDAGFSTYYFDDGYPPIYENWCDSGEFEQLCDAYRGNFPHAVTRMEFRQQIAEIEYQRRLGAQSNDPR